MEIPQTFKKRNEFGLKEGVEYKFSPDGRISWKDMIDPKYLVINKACENKIVEKLGKPLSEITVDEVDDSQKLTLLMGSHELLELRGYNKLKYSQPVYGENGSVSVECSIEFLPNYETDMRVVESSWVGEATTNNTAPIGKNKLDQWQYFLAATAANRAFVMCLRKFLKIPILSKEEAQFETVSTQTAPISGLNPHSMLQDILDQKKPKITLEILKKTVLNHYKDSVKSDPSSWVSLKDIPPNDVFSIIGLLKKDKNG